MTVNEKTSNSPVCYIDPEDLETVKVTTFPPLLWKVGEHSPGQIPLYTAPQSADLEIRYAHLLQQLGAKNHEEAVAVVKDIQTAVHMLAQAKLKRERRARRNQGVLS